MSFLDKATPVQTTSVPSFMQKATPVNYTKLNEQLKPPKEEGFFWGIKKFYGWGWNRPFENIS